MKVSSIARSIRSVNRSPALGSLSRRDLLESLGSGTLLCLLSSCSAKPPVEESDTFKLADELYYSSAASLVKAIRRKEISSEELVKVFLKRIEAVNPKLNAVVQLAAEKALMSAKEADSALARGDRRGPLHGLPITLKDSIDTAGVISTGGTIGRAKYVPPDDASVAARLRAAGTILLGKTNTPQLTLSYETNNLVYGQTSNPFDLSCSPGGSSGGPAAIIAAGGSPLDIGSDTGGSIRYPAHCCGIAGIKPTSGRVPRTGHIYPFGGFIDSFTQLGPLARFVDDLILTLPILIGVDWRDPAIVPMPLGDPAAVDLKTLRVSFHVDNGIHEPTSEVKEAVRQAARALSGQVMSVEEVRPKGIEQTNEIITGLWRADGGAFTRKLLLKAGTIESLEEDKIKPISMLEFSALMDRWDTFRSTMTAFLENYDVILTPAFVGPAPPQGPPTNSELYSYTQTYNLTGWPGAVVRGGTSPEGLPIGVQIVTRPWREDVTLAVAKYLETAFGGFQPPDV